MDLITHLGLHCPYGGTFYVCDNSITKFIGCCTINPCISNGSCPQDRLRSSSFNASRYAELPLQACTVATAKWYTCARVQIPFLGCCLSNACEENGCPVLDLKPAILLNKSYKETITSISAGSTLSAEPTLTFPTYQNKTQPVTNTTPSTATSGVENYQPHEREPTGLSLGLNAKEGIGIAALVLLVLIGIAVLLAKRRHRSHRNQSLHGDGDAAGSQLQPKHRLKRDSFWEPTHHM